MGQQRWAVLLNTITPSEHSPGPSALHHCNESSPAQEQEKRGGWNSGSSARGGGSDTGSITSVWRDGKSFYPTRRSWPQQNPSKTLVLATTWVNNCLCWCQCWLLFKPAEHLFYRFFFLKGYWFSCAEVNPVLIRNTYSFKWIFSPFHIIDLAFFAFYLHAGFFFCLVLLVVFFFYLDIKNRKCLYDLKLLFSFCHEQKLAASLLS